MNPIYDTKIDCLDIDNEQLIIRGKNLCDMIQEYGFTDAITHTMLNKALNKKEKRIFEAVLVSFMAGFEITPPVIYSARHAASTGVPVTQALAAGYCASGPYHTGAVEEAMKFYQEIYKNSRPETLQKYVNDIVEEKLANKERIFGFGHQVFKEDPRPKALRELVSDTNYESKYIDIYDTVCEKIYEKKGLNPNIDGINSSLLCSLDFPPEAGTGIFMFSRTIGMLTHILEEKQKPPFDVWYKTVTQKLKNLYP
ncbi:MAG: citrate/2-methylcitrate synthase [Bacteroidota bacterium]